MTSLSIPSPGTKNVNFLDDDDDDDVSGLECFEDDMMVFNCYAMNDTLSCVMLERLYETCDQENINRS